MSTIYIVTTGEYSDYGIVAAFSDRATADGVKDALNADNPYAHADVEEFPLHGSEFVSGRWMSRRTVVSRSGDVGRSTESSELDAAGRHTGSSSTSVRPPRLALEPYDVYTHGDATRVPQAHADAVAKLRAELMGL